MKKILSTILLSMTILFASCGSISVKKDDFTGATIVKMPLVHFSSNFFAGRMDAVYVKEFNNNTINPTIVQVKIITPTNYTFPEDELLIKIYGAIHSAEFSDVSGEIHTKYNNGVMTQYKLYNARIQLTDEIEAKLKEANDIAYRVNLGVDQPVTYILKGDEIKKIKQFLETVPEKG